MTGREEVSMFFVWLLSLVYYQYVIRLCVVLLMFLCRFHCCVSPLVVGSREKWMKEKKEEMWKKKRQTNLFGFSLTHFHQTFLKTPKQHHHHHTLTRTPSLLKEGWKRVKGRAGSLKFEWCESVCVQEGQQQFFSHNANHTQPSLVNEGLSRTR